MIKNNHVIQQCLCPRILKECRVNVHLLQALLTGIVYEQKLVNSLNGLLNCEIGGLHCRVITTESIIVYPFNTYLVMHWSM